MQNKKDLEQRKETQWPVSNMSCNGFPAPDLPVSHSQVSLKTRADGSGKKPDLLTRWNCMARQKSLAKLRFLDVSVWFLQNVLWKLDTWVPNSKSVSFTSVEKKTHWSPEYFWRVVLYKLLGLIPMALGYLGTTNCSDQLPHLRSDGVADAASGGSHCPY